MFWERVNKKDEGKEVAKRYGYIWMFKRDIYGKNPILNNEL